MDPTSVIMFILVAGFVWGGFAVTLGLAVRKESGKPGKGSAEAVGGGDGGGKRVDAGLEGS